MSVMCESKRNRYVDRCHLEGSNLKAVVPLQEGRLQPLFGWPQVDVFGFLNNIFLHVSLSDGGSRRTCLVNSSSTTNIINGVGYTWICSSDRSILRTTYELAKDLDRAFLSFIFPCLMSYHQQISRGECWRFATTPPPSYQRDHTQKQNNASPPVCRIIGDGVVSHDNSICTHRKTPSNTYLFRTNSSTCFAGWSSRGCCFVAIS